MKKGQAALEFILLVGFMFLVFVAFFGVIQGRLHAIQENNIKQALRDQVLLLQNEIKTASVLENGFQHRVELPQTINGKEYNVTLYGQKGGTDATMELMLQYIEEPSYESSFTLPKTVDTTWIMKSNELLFRELTVGEEFCLLKKAGILFVEEKELCNII